MDSLDRDVRREQPKANRDELLRAALRVLGERPAPRETPDDDDAREPFNCARNAKADESDRARRNARDNRHDAFDRHPAEACPREELGAPGTA